MSDVGCEMQDRGCGMQGVRCEMQDAEQGMQGAGCRMWDFGGTGREEGF